MTDNRLMTEPDWVEAHNKLLRDFDERLALRLAKVIALNKIMEQPFY